MHIIPRASIALFVLIAGCSDVAPDERSPARPKNEAAATAAGTEAGSVYRCDDGATVRVRFDRTSGGAEVTIGDATPIMLPERYDSLGLVYTDDTTEVRMAGADITVGPRGGPSRTCRVGG